MEKLQSMACRAEQFSIGSRLPQHGMHTLNALELIWTV